MAIESPSLRIGLLDNSYHSLKRGYEMWSQWKKTEDAWLLKESIIWVHHGIELALKQLLAQTNAFLVFEDVNKAVQSLGNLREKKGMEKAGVLDLFDNDDKIMSVGFRNLIERAAVTLSIPELTKNALLRQKIDELTKYRNKVVHFSIEIDIASVSNLLSEILDPLLSMLEREVLDEVFTKNRIPEIREIAQPVKKFSEQLNKQMQEAVHKAIHATINSLPPKGNRKAGIVWQSVGAGLRAIVIGYLMEVKKIPNLRHNHIIVITNRVDTATQIYLQISAIMSQVDTCKVVIPDSAIAVVEALNSEEPKIVVSTHQKFISDTFFFGKDCLLVSYNVYLSSASIKVSLPNATHILFTNSPPQLDTRFMLNFGEIVSKYDFKQAVLDGFVMPFRIEKRIPELNFNNPSLIATEFDLDVPLSVPMNAPITYPTRIAFLSEDIVNHFRSRQKTFLGKGIVVVSDIQSGVAYSQTISNINGNAGFVETISSKTSAEQRELLVKNFLKQDDPLCILVMTASFLEGMDNPLIHTIYVTSPVSLQLEYQLAGLVSRLSPGKEDALIVDYVGLNLYLDDLFENGNNGS